MRFIVDRLPKETIYTIFLAIISLYSIASVQSKCERYWCDEINKPLEMPDRGFTVTVTGKKVYADYEIKDIIIKYVSVQSRSCVLFMT